MTIRNALVPATQLGQGDILVIGETPFVIISVDNFGEKFVTIKARLKSMPIEATTITLEVPKPLRFIVDDAD